jgi:hypothetical protein
MSNWLRDTHCDQQGKPSWTRQAGTTTLILLFTGLFFGVIEWGQAFVGALALIFGLKGTQKWREKNMARKGEGEVTSSPSQAGKIKG